MDRIHDPEPFGEGVVGLNPNTHPVATDDRCSVDAHDGVAVRVDIRQIRGSLGVSNSSDSVESDDLDPLPLESLSCTGRSL